MRKPSRLDSIGAMGAIGRSRAGSRAELSPKKEAPPPPMSPHKYLIRSKLANSTSGIFSSTHVDGLDNDSDEEELDASLIATSPSKINLLSLFYNAPSPQYNRNLCTVNEKTGKPTLKTLKLDATKFEKEKKYVEAAGALIDAMSLSPRDVHLSKRFKSAVGNVHVQRPYWFAEKKQFQRRKGGAKKGLGGEVEEYYLPFLEEMLNKYSKECVTGDLAGDPTGFEDVVPDLLDLLVRLFQYFRTLPPAGGVLDMKLIRDTDSDTENTLEDEDFAVYAQQKKLRIFEHFSLICPADGDSSVATPSASRMTGMFGITGNLAATRRDSGSSGSRPASVKNIVDSALDSDNEEEDGEGASNGRRRATSSGSASSSRYGGSGSDVTDDDEKSGEFLNETMTLFQFRRLLKVVGFVSVSTTFSTICLHMLGGCPDGCPKLHPLRPVSVRDFLHFATEFMMTRYAKFGKLADRLSFFQGEMVLPLVAALEELRKTGGVKRMRQVVTLPTMEDVEAHMATAEFWTIAEKWKRKIGKFFRYYRDGKKRKGKYDVYELDQCINFDRLLLMFSRTLMLDDDFTPEVLAKVCGSRDVIVICQCKCASFCLAWCMGK
mmetsp:Transcript_30341/g.78514  ORF Transcript_30341/g.78514 Transcript_30341/m.78514 type:complete len:604 (-) Transcript_30341:365-2176(-)